MRLLRIPIIESDAQQVPEWIIGDLERRREQDEQREAPRLELPVPGYEYPEHPPEPKPAEAPSTVIVIDL